MYFYFLVFISIFPTLTFSQTVEDKLSQLVKESLKELPYRDFSSEFVVKFDSLQNKYAFISKKKFSKRIENEITDKIEKYLIATNNHKKYNGVFRFDSYTKEIYVQTKEESPNQIFESIPMNFQPLGGMDNFKTRWISYLDSLHKNQLFEWQLVPTNTTVQFFVKGGLLIPVKNSQYENLIADFLKKEKQWHSIHSGRPIYFQVDLELPTYVQKEKAIQHRYHEAVNAITKDKQIFINYNLNSLTFNMNVVSFVNNDGLLQNPIIHRGDLDKCKDIIDVMSKRNEPKFHGLTERQFNRIYYYTINN